MSRQPSESFIGHPDAILFWRFSREGVFQHPQAFTPTIPIGRLDFDGQALGLGSGAQLSFQFRMDTDAHRYRPRPLSKILTRHFTVVIV